MKLYIKKDKSELNSRFRVFDEFGNDKYYVTGDINATTHKMSICSTNNSDILKIRMFSLPVLADFLIYDKNDSFRVVATHTSSKMNISFHGISWHIRGDLLSKNFDIVDADNKVIAAHIKRWERECENYELTVYSTNREIFALASVICINSINIVNSKMFQTV